MDYTSPDDERQQHAAGFPNPMVSKKMKLLIKVLSLVLIILLLPFATNHCLPLLRPMGMSLLQRLWDVLRFIAMTTAISVGIISTSQRKGLDRSDYYRSDHDDRRAPRKEPTAMVKDSHQWKVQEVDKLHQWKGKEVDNVQKWKGKEVVDQAATSSDSHSTEAIYGSTTGGFSMLLAQEDEVFEPRKLVISSSRSASEAWFSTAGLVSKIEEGEEEGEGEGEEEAWVSSSGCKTHHAHQGSSTESRKKASFGSIEKQISRETMLDGARKTSDPTPVHTEYPIAGRRPTSRLDLESENGKRRRRSSSLDRPIQQQRQDPGLKLLDGTQKAIVKLSDRSIQVYNANQHPVSEALNRPTKDRHKISTPNAEANSNPIAKQADAKMGSNQILQKQNESQMGSRQQIVQKEADAKMVSNQIMQKLANAKLVSDEVLKKQHQAEMGSAQTEDQQADASVGSHKGQFHRTSSTNRLILSSKHSKSALNLDQLNASAKPPRSSRRNTSYSCDFGDDCNPEWLFQEPPPPPGLSESEAEDSSSPNPVKTTSKSTGLKLNIAQSLVPWRSSVPINISNPTVSHPSSVSPPEETLSSAISPSSGEVNRRADEFINNFNTRLIRQKQESLERHRRWSQTRGSDYY